MSGLRRMLNRTPGDRSTGQTLVEFAMVLPMFIFLLLMLFDFGRAVYTQHTLTEDAREGARLGLAAPDLRLNDGVTQPQDLYDAIRDAALRLSQGTGITPAQITGAAGACDDVPLTVDTTSPTTCFYPDGAEPGDRVVVKVSTDVQIITPILSNLVGGTFTVNAESVSYLK